MTPVREALGWLLDAIAQEVKFTEATPLLKRRVEAATKALSAARGEPCAVKPLEWVDEPNREPEYPAWNASNPFGLNYRIFKAWWGARDKWAFMYGSCFHHTVDEAKASAQADYEQRIRSALVTTPQPAAGWNEAALKALMDAGKLMAVCEFCSSSYPEGCGHYDLEDLRETPDGAWVCENCWDNSDDKPIWEDLPHVKSLRREAPAPAEGVNALRHARSRFEQLAENFEKAGDNVQRAMCSVDAQMMGKALARPETAEAPSPPADRREIVARWLYEHQPIDSRTDEIGDEIPWDALAGFLKAVQYTASDELLAALDGGRDA